MQVDRYKIHDIELVVDRLQVTEDLKSRLSQSVQQTLKLGKDLMFLQVASPILPPQRDKLSKGGALESDRKKNSKSNQDSERGHLAEVVVQYSKLLMCEDTGISYEEPSPNAFSFNSPYGACPACKGLGTTFHINMDAVIPDPSVSINEGGIAPLGEEREAWVFRQAQEIARRIRFHWPNL